MDSRPPPGVCDGDGSSDLLLKLMTEEGVGVAVGFEFAESGRWKPVKV